MGLFDNEIFGSFWTVPLDGWCSIFTIVERVLSWIELIELSDNILVEIFYSIVFDNHCKLTFTFLQIEQQFEEGR